MITTLSQICRHLSVAGCVAAGLTLGVMATGCSSDDHAPIFQPTLPATGGDCVRSIEHQGSMMASYDWTFHYDGTRLVQAQGTMRDADPKADKSYRYTSYLGYGTSWISVTNQPGEAVNIQLNSEGYIDRMTVGQNDYRFRYLDGRLVEWSKTVYENTFGQQAMYTSTGKITYDNGNYSKLEYVGPDSERATLTFTSTDLVNRNGLLPVGVTKELGMLGFDHLYYAGLLGRPIINLVRSVDYTSPRQTYTINYEYSSRSGNTVLCNFHAPDGKIASVNYTY